jgi:hypothetical protein
MNQKSQQAEFPRRTVFEGQRHDASGRVMLTSPVALMIPCYVDVFYPEVGIATLELLEKLGVEVVYPFDQTCCGQPSQQWML